MLDCMSNQPARPPSNSSRNLHKTSHRGALVVSVLCVLALVAATLYGWHIGLFSRQSGDNVTTSAAADSEHPDGPSQLVRKATPKPDLSPTGTARRMVEAMDLESRIGQLVMIPLYAGTDPSALQSFIADRHVGSALIIGN